MFQSRKQLYTGFYWKCSTSRSICWMIGILLSILNWTISSTWQLNLKAYCYIFTDICGYLLISDFKNFDLNIKKSCGNEIKFVLYCYYYLRHSRIYYSLKTKKYKLKTFIIYEDKVNDFLKKKFWNSNCTYYGLLLKSNVTYAEVKINTIVMYFLLYSI